MLSVIKLHCESRKTCNTASTSMDWDVALPNERSGMRDAQAEGRFTCAQQKSVEAERRHVHGEFSMSDWYFSGKRIVSASGRKDGKWLP
jgi:hypothetical protein